MNPQNTNIMQELPTILPKSGLRILLKTDENDSRPVYISGNFNKCRPQDKEFILEQIAANKYQFEFQSDFDYPDELLYKFTKGDWSEVEIGKNNEITTNRSSTLKAGIIEEYVPKWRKNWLPFKPNFLPQVYLHIQLLGIN
jgi:hypothetical protein